MTSLRRPAVLASAVIALQLVVYALVALPGSFYLDDLSWTNRAAAASLDWDYLRGPSGHHLIPGSMAWFWFQAHVMPFHHTGAVLITLALQGLTTFALWRLLRELFGERHLTAVPLALYALTPLSVPTFAWWIQSVCLLPVHLAIIGATLQQVRYVRTGRLRHALGGGLWVLFGLLFWEKAVLAVALPVLVTLLVLTSGSLWSRVRSMLRMWPVWLALLAPPVAFVSLYSGQDRQEARGVSVGSVLHLLADSTTHYVIPSLLGGPWRWTRKDFYGIADPALWQVVLACVVVGLLVVATVVRRRAAAWGWLLLAVYVPLSLAPVAIGRLAQYGVVVGRDSRYITDIAVAAALAVGLVLMPVRTSVTEPVAVPRPVHSRPVGAGRPLAAALACLALLASTAVSDVRFAGRWHDNPTGDYLAALQDDLPARGSANLFDQQLPVDVLSPFYEPYNTLSALLEQLPGKARFSDGMVAQSLVTEQGEIRVGIVEPSVTSVKGPLKDCGYAVNDDNPTATVPMEADVFPFVGRTARVELLLSKATPVTVRTNEGVLVGDQRVLPRGPAAVVGLVGGGDVSSFEVSGLAPGAAACVLKIVMGKPVPL